MISVRDLRKGSCFKLFHRYIKEDNDVYIRGEYSFSERKYICRKYSDPSCIRLFSGNLLVYKYFKF